MTDYNSFMKNSKTQKFGEEVGILAAIWSLRALLHPKAFKQFSRSIITGGEEIFQVIGMDKIDLEKFSHKELSLTMKICLQSLEKQDLKREEPLFSNIDNLGKIIGLSKYEKQILLFAIITENTPGLREALGFPGPCSVPGLINHLTYILKIKAEDVHETLGIRGPLLSSGIIDLQRYRGSLDIADRLEVLDGLAHILQEPHADLETALSTFFSKVSPPKQTMADFEHLGEDPAILCSFLAASLEKKITGVNVLIYGTPGTGKTELVKVVASHLGMSLYEVSSEDTDGDPASKDQRLRSYFLCQSLFSRRRDCLILFDEIEDIFPSESQGILGLVVRSGRNKGWTNRILEQNTVPAIWVSNTVAQIDPAFLRRFDLVLEVPIPPASVRRQMFRKMMGGLAIRDEFVEAMSNNQHIVPGHLEKAFKVAGLVGEKDQASSEKVLSRVVHNLHKAMGLPAKVAHSRHKTGVYDLAFLNTDLNMESLVEICRVEAALKTCLHGPPGTGKTAYVHYLAERLNKKIIAKKASDILNPFVGQTEHHLASMFQEAEQADGILFLDEADSFLQDRLRARHSWEITKVNELLVQVENFGGLFFCATNLMETLDHAVFRRFDLKVRFDFLKPPQAWKLFQKILAVHGADLPMDREMWCRAKLAKLGRLTPADFNVVERQLRLTRESIDVLLFLDYLEQECLYKGGDVKHPVGF